MRRHIAQAAWFFGTEALADPSDPSSLNNFAAMTAELAVEDPDAVDPVLAAAALEAARAAARLAPDSAAVQNTLGNAARAAGETAEAVAAAERATELDPEEPLYWTNLARARAAAGDIEGAADALLRARQLEPNGSATLATTIALPAVLGPYQQRLGPICDIDFDCDAICPGGITGRIMMVTCEMANAGAQLSCQQGEPYPVSYNCQEEFPEYGILIPGLNSGFSVSMPGFSAHVLLDGNGDVRVRLQAGSAMGRFGVYMGVDGTWSPSNGASFDEFRAGARINILPRGLGGGSDIDQRAGAHGQSPMTLEFEASSNGEAHVSGEVYNAGVVSM
jgi:hypothetical protein